MIYILEAPIYFFKLEFLFKKCLASIEIEKKSLVSKGWKHFARWVSVVVDAHQLTDRVLLVDILHFKANDK